MNFSLARSALLDIEAIAQYLAREAGESIADDMISRLFDVFDRLADHPRIGRVRDDLAPASHRFWYEEPYMIVYRTDRPSVHIVRVIHGARDLGAALDAPEA